LYSLLATYTENISTKVSFIRNAIFHLKTIWYICDNVSPRLTPNDVKYI